MSRLLRLLLVLLVPLSTMSGQNTASPQLKFQPIGPKEVPSGGTDRLIILDVQVRDKSGTPVRGLQQQDFTVLDDKHPQKIVSFQAVDAGAAVPSDPPAEIVLIVDALNASVRAFTYEREGVEKFLQQKGGKLAGPLSVIVFPDDTTVKGSGDAVGRTNLSLKTLDSLAATMEKRAGRKLMIWVSPGWPLLTGPNTQLSSDEERQIFQSIVAASTKLRQARVTLYDVDPNDVVESAGIRVTHYENFLKGVSSPSQALPGDLGLQVLSVQSGGSVFNSYNDVTAAIADAVADADGYYVLSFEVGSAHHANEYHSLQIRVDKPGMTARTRTGYYAQP